MNILMATADHLMIDRRILQEAKGLIGAGHEVTLLAGFECEQRQSYTANNVKIERFAFDWSYSSTVPWYRGFRFGLNKIIDTIAPLLMCWLPDELDFTGFDKFVYDRMLEYKCDVIHVHDFPMLRAGVELARMRKVPLIYDAHEIYYAQTQFPSATQRLYKHRERKWIKFADRTITVNPFIAQLMAKRYSIKPPEVILNASPIQPRITDHPLRNRFGLSESTHIVLHQGWISDNRGIDKLVLAARHFDESIVLVIVGYGDYKKELKRLVRENQLEQRVYFYGGVDSDKLHNITCDADLGLIPYFGVDDNNYFCSPNKLFELIIAELPFVCNDLPYLRQVVDQYGNGLTTDLREPKKIAEAINKLFGSPEKLSNLRAGALAAKLEMNWEVEERKLLSIYHSLGF